MFFGVEFLNFFLLLVVLELLEGACWRELVLLHLSQPIALGSDENQGAGKNETKTGFKTLSFSLFFERRGGG
jgi:hypothetical protein